MNVNVIAAGPHPGARQARDQDPVVTIVSGAIPSTTVTIDGVAPIRLHLEVARDPARQVAGTEKATDESTGTTVVITAVAAVSTTTDTTATGHDQHHLQTTKPKKRLLWVVLIKPLWDHGVLLLRHNFSQSRGSSDYGWQK